MTAPLLETRDVTIRFEGLVAVNQVSIAIAPGEVRGLIGPNGAGRRRSSMPSRVWYAPRAGDVLRRRKHLCHAGASPRGNRHAPHLSVCAAPADLTVLENVLVGLHTQFLRRVGAHWAVDPRPKRSTRSPACWISLALDRRS